MSLLDGAELKQWILPKEDIYHEEHPMHWLVLEEEELWDEAYAEYDHVQNEGIS